jgi:hypothetical protein
LGATLVVIALFAALVWWRTGYLLALT